MDSSDSSWLERFDAAVEKAELVVEASQGEFRESVQGATIYEFVNKLILGAAELEAANLNSPVKTATVWDGSQPVSVGGAADCIALWKKAGFDLDFWIHSGTGELVPPEELVNPNDPCSKESEPQSIKAILFADVVGFSSLADYHLPEFFNEFLKRIADRVVALDIEPLASNSWGDAYYLVFATVREAGLFALAFQKAIEEENWDPVGKGKPLRFRIALNAGPVFEIQEALTGCVCFVGQPTNRAARIEPITEEGQIFVSEYFADLAAVERVRDFSLSFVGNRPLPKNYGTSRVFLLSANEPSTTA